MKKDFLKTIWTHCRWSMALAVLLFGVLAFFLHQHIHIFFTLVNILFVFSVLGLLAKIKSKLLSGFFTFIVSFILSVSISFAILFSSPLTVGNIASFFETNISEVSSLSFSYLSVFFICLLLATIFVFKVKSELEECFSSQVFGCVFFMLVLLMNGAAILIPVRQDSHFISYYQKELREVPLQTIYAYSSMRSPLLYGDILGLAVYSLEKLEFRRFKNFEKKLPEGVTLEKGKTSVPKIYLVVGESAYRKRMSLYGYEIKTTPFLDSIAKVDSSPLNFYNGISIANITRDAVRFSLSFATPFDKDAFWKEKNAVELAKDAGYYTSWISNQGQAGLYDNYPSYIAKSSDQVYFETKLKKDDLDLLSLLKTYDRKVEKQLITFHLMGSHFPFIERCDKTDDSYFDYRYTENEYPNSSLNYDKSIHHTDRFLKALYEYTQLNDEQSIIIYFSDHGANPYRDVHGLMGYMESEFEIPFLILNHDVDVDINAIVSQYDSKGYINNVNLIYIISQLMGYSVDDTTRKKARKDGGNVMLVNGGILPFDLMGIVCF